MSYTTRTIHSAHKLHLFRALLRECTYLPDPNARKFVHAHIVDRFRAYTPHPYRVPEEGKIRNDAVVRERLLRLMKKAEQTLRLLQRACHGHRDPLERVLSLTYGRTGPRRRELLEFVKSPDTPEDGAMLEEELKGFQEPKNWKVPQISGRLLTMAKSQASNHPADSPRKTLRHYELKIEKYNLWGRPMPIKRVRNKKRRFYADVIDRILPPLPLEEWTELQRRTQGSIPFEGVIPRRGRVSDSGIGGVLYKRHRKISRPHRVTARYMRHMWMQVFELCPVVEQREHIDIRKRTKITWGGSQKTAVHALGVSRSFDLGSFFSGVNEDGSIPRTATEREALTAST